MNTSSGGPLNFEALIDDSKWTNSITRMERQMLGLTSTVVQQSSLIDREFARIGQLAAGYFSFQALAQLPEQILKVRGEFQSLEIAFTTMLRSKEKANALLTEVVKAASETPFGLKDIASGAKQLLAYGSSAQTVVGEIRMLGDVAAGVSVPINELIYLYGTLRSQGRAYAVDIRQFAGRGIPIYQALADVLQVNVDKVNDLVSDGKVGFKQVEQAFKNMTSAGGLFNGTLEAQSKSLNGLKERLSDAYDVMLNDIGKANEGIIAESLKGATGLVENYRTVIDVLQVIVATYGTYKAALLLASVAQQVQVFMLERIALEQGLAALSGEVLTTQQARQIVVTKLLQQAQMSLNATMLANPFVLVATALAAVVAAYFTFREEVTQIKSAQELLAESGKQVGVQYRQQGAEVKNLVGIIKNQNIAESERIKAYEKLKQVAPDILTGLDFQKAKTADLTKATNDYIASLQQKIRLETASAGLKTALEQDVEAAEKLKTAQDELTKRAQAAKASGSSVLTGPDARGGGVGAALDLDRAQRNLDKAVLAKRQTAQVVDQINSSISKIYTGGTKEQVNAEISRLELVRSNLKDKLSPAYKDVEDQLKSLTEQRNKLTQAESGGAKQVAKTVDYYDQQIKKLKDDQQQSTSRGQYDAFQKQIDALVKQRSRLTGEMTAAEKKALKDADKVGPLGSLSYYENVAKKAQEILDKTPETDTAKIAKQTAIRNEADANAERIRKNQAVKSFSEELETKKGQYELFQKYIDQYGRAAAEIQFAELQKSGADYVSFLNRQIELLETKRNAGKLSEKDAINLGSLLDERNAFTGQKTAIELFKDGLEQAKQSATSLADYLITLRQRQAELNPGDNSSAGIAKRKEVAEQIVQTERELQGQLTQFLNSYASSAGQQLAIQRSYADKRAALDKRYNDKRSDEYKRNLAIIDQAEKDDLENYQRHKLEETQVFKDAQKVILEEGEKGRKIQVERQRAVVAEAEKLYGKNSQIVKEQQEKLNQLLKPQEKNGIGQFDYYAGIIGEFGQQLSQLEGEAGKAGQALVALSQTGAQLSAIMKGGMSDAELYQAAIANVIAIFSAITTAAAQRKQVEMEYYASLIAQQQQYNLLLNEQIGLRTKSTANVFVRDYVGELNDGFAKYANARAKYEESIKKLSEGRAKAGLKNQIDGAVALKLIGNGATAGAAIGTAILPGVGTAIGAVGGAIVGGLTALFGGAKKKAAEFKGLLEEYPDLIKKGANGVEEINAELAQSLIQQGLVDDQTKVLIQTTLDWQKQMEEAKEAIRGIVSELAGSLGGQLSDALVGAFRNGESAAESFRNSVSKVMEDLVNKMLFQKAFGELFKQLEEDLGASLGPKGDGAVIDDFQRFTENSKGALELYNQWLAQFQQSAKDSGFDVLQPTNGSSATKTNAGLSGAIKSISEESAGILAGQITAIRISQAQTGEVVRQSLVQLTLIEGNTRPLYSVLQSIDTRLERMEKSDPLRAKGL